jgi:hypothetical protein
MAKPHACKFHAEAVRNIKTQFDVRGSTATKYEDHTEILQNKAHTRLHAQWEPETQHLGDHIQRAFALPGSLRTNMYAAFVNEFRVHSTSPRFHASNLYTHVICSCV